VEVPPIDSDRETRLLSAARAGDSQALSHLFQSYQLELERMIDLRLEPALRRRMDPADIVQEAWVEIVKRFGEWSASGTIPFRVWLRLSTLQSLGQARRRHVAAGIRDVGREAPLADLRPSVSAVALAEVFVASTTSPSAAAQREEVRQRVLAALSELDEIDREVILLRRFENLSNSEIAAELGIEPAAASRRFARAILRLKPALLDLADPSRGGSA